MARAVLEREGFGAATDADPSSVAVQVDDETWTLRTADGAVRGDTFRALAAHLRALPPGKEETES
jgi:hypothetical protein